MQVCKILLADDDPDDRSIIMDAMETMHAGKWMKFADNGQKVLDMLEEEFGADNTPQLIVLDLNMPKMNGTQTLGHLKRDDRFKDIPVIIYSTSINPLEREKCMTLGAHSYMTKPVSFNESVERARIFLEFCEPKM